MAQTLGIGCDVTYKFAKFQVFFVYSLLCHFAFEFDCSLDFDKERAEFSGFLSSKLGQIFGVLELEV
jgi:hypothetical protein